MADHPVVILFHNRFFDDWPHVPNEARAGGEFTTDPRSAACADAIVFHIPTLSPTSMPPRRSGQLWVAWSLESRVMVPLLDDEVFMSQFDLSMTYERSSDVWWPYFEGDIVRDVPLPVVRPKTGPNPVVCLQSNRWDACGRLEYLGQVMKRVKVDSYGSVHRNQSVELGPGRRARQELYSRYKMTLAFENSFATDYVTEKFYEPLIAGSVPVYRGTAEVAELAPAPGCYIDAANFGSARELASYLSHLDTHDEEYLAYHEWRSTGFSPGFERYLAQFEEHPLVRLATRVAEIRGDRGRKTQR